MGFGDIPLQIRKLEVEFMPKYLYIVLCCLLIAVTSLPVQGQSPPKPRDTTIVGPQTFAMIMGISQYLKVRPLQYADKDAELFRDFLRSPAAGNLPEDNILLSLE
jgi:hypothetical protein